MLDGFEHAGVGAGLAAVLADAVVLLHGADELATFTRIVRASLFYVNVFPGLAGPDGHERVPMIGSGDGDGVNVFVVEELANIHVGFRLWQAELLDLSEALVGDAFVDIAESGQLGLWNTRETVDVIVAAAAHSADGHAYAIICAENLAA